MAHVDAINRIMTETGMGEMAAINLYQAQKRIGEDRRRGSRGLRPVISTNWLK